MKFTDHRECMHSQIIEKRRKKGTNNTSHAMKINSKLQIKTKQMCRELYEIYYFLFDKHGIRCVIPI